MQKPQGPRQKHICDPSEQKQPFGCTLTIPPHITPLRPGSTFIDWFSRAIYQKIANFNSYPLRYQFWKSVNNCGVWTQWRNLWWIRQGAPKRLLLLGGVTYRYIHCEICCYWTRGIWAFALSPTVKSKQGISNHYANFRSYLFLLYCVVFLNINLLIIYWSTIGSNLNSSKS